MSEIALEAAGVAVEQLPAGRFPHSGRRVQFMLPGGHVMQLYAEKDRVGNSLPTRNPGTLASTLSNSSEMPSASLRVPTPSTSPSNPGLTATTVANAHRTYVIVTISTE